ncbi:MAG: glycosyltransferase [Fibrobacterota bacterium]
MVRVLFFNYSNEPGGAEQSLLGLLSGLDKSRFNPSLLTFGHGPLSERARNLGITVHTLEGAPGLSAFGRDRLLSAAVRGLFHMPALFRTLVKIRRVLREGRFAVLHTNNPKSHVLGALASAGLPIRLVFHMRDIFPHKSNAARLLSLLGRVRKAQTLAISRAVQKALPAGLKNRSHLLYNGVLLPCPALSRAAVRTGLGIPDNALLIMSTGRLVPWKGFDLLIRAAAPLLARYEARLLIAGEAYYGERDLRPELIALAGTLGVPDRVMLPGYVEDIPSLLAAADLFVLPSENEPFGRALVEAMLAGLPCVAFNQGGPAEIILHNETGWLVDERSAPALQDALARLLSDAELRRVLGERAKIAAREQFPLARTLAGLATFYDGLEA